MSLESQMQTLTDAINNLAFIMQQQTVLAAAAPVAASVVKIAEPRPIPVVEAFPPVIPTAAATPAVAMPAVAMPAPPFVVTLAPVKAPFTDAKGLMDYVMASYTALGADKGAQIQDIMVGLGYQHINDIKAEHYGTLFEKVEALK